MKKKHLHEGAEVYWTDPDNDSCSGFFIVDCFLTEDVVLLRNDDGSLLEAFLHELS